MHIGLCWYTSHPLQIILLFMSETPGEVPVDYLGISSGSRSQGSGEMKM
jgi:hypothetical protein